MKKKFGQNFLSDANILEKIIHSVPHDYPVLEIGTGNGILTSALAKVVSCPVYSFEIDPEAFDHARENLRTWPHIRLFNEDFLKTSFMPDRDFVVIANIPYYITSPIIDKCLNYVHLKGMYIMIQKEIAARITASPGNKDYSSFSIYCQTRASVSKLFPVSRHCFFPKPDVDSCFLELLPTDNYLRQIKDITFYNHVIHSSFWGKRKTLINCLSGSPYLSFEKEDLIRVFHELNMDTTIRGEKLSIEDFIRLSNALSPLIQTDSRLKKTEPDIA